MVRVASIDSTETKDLVESTAVGLYAPPGYLLCRREGSVVAQPFDPTTLEPAPEGADGIARIEDLLNVDSAFAVLTADRVRRVEGGFELLGRAPGAPPRGCSIALDEMLGSDLDLTERSAGAARERERERQPE